MKRIITVLALLALPSWGGAIEVYNSRTPDVYRGASPPVQKGRQIEVYQGGSSPQVYQGSGIKVYDGAGAPKVYEPRRTPAVSPPPTAPAEAPAREAIPAPSPKPSPVAAKKEERKTQSAAPGKGGGVDYLYTTYQCHRLGFNGQSMITNVVFTLNSDGTYIDPVKKRGRYRINGDKGTIDFLDGNLQPAKGSYEQMRDGGPRVYLSYDESGWTGLNCAKQ